jgi:hypothetical protein
MYIYIYIWVCLSPSLSLHIFFLPGNCQCVGQMANRASSKVHGFEVHDRRVNLHEKLARKQQLWIVAALLDRASAAMAPKKVASPGEAKPVKEALKRLSDNSVDLGNITPEDLKHLGAEDFKSLYTKMTKQLKNQKEVFAEYSKMKSIPM